mmetsp:Transcript_96787/g.278458  ORF Transcript_96787/g.278458 Transcript_96787/m.278458 type:complete len:271 (-) Transcript_96787:93-905(-)
MVGVASADRDVVEVTGLAQASLCTACGVFALQAALHWTRAVCSAPGPRAQQHETLSGVATGTCALFYQGMAFGMSQRSCTVGDAGKQAMFDFHYLGRSLGGALVLINAATLARERRAPAVAVAASWAAETAALYMGALAGKHRTSLLLSACLLLLPLAASLLGIMGGRLRRSPLEGAFRFVSAWCTSCAVCYVLVFYLAEVACLLNTETEIVAYTLLDWSFVGASSLVISCAGPELQAVLLPAQEEELSLYPGPHNHGFFPNPDYYDDNL